MRALLPVLCASTLVSCGASPVRPLTVTIPAPHAPCPSTTEVQVAETAQQGGVLRGNIRSAPYSLTLDGNAVPIAPDGYFLIAFDRDASTLATLRVQWDALCVAERHIAVSPGQWDIQSVNAPITGSATSEQFKSLRGPELEKIAAARATMTPGSSEGWRQDFIWPVVARISGRFGSQRIYRGTPGSYHGGVDLAAPAGTTYVAPADGVVILAASAPYTLEGNLLLIDHGMGLHSAFLHSARLLVREGDVVRRGQPIGIVGATGRATGPHLHWGLKWGDARLDPVTLVAP